MTAGSAPQSLVSAFERIEAARGDVALTFLRVQHPGGPAGVRGGAARRLGARDRHGRPLGCGQCGRSGCRRGGEHRFRPSGIPGHDARGHRAREGRYFSARPPGGARQPRHARRASKSVARSVGAPLKRLGIEYSYVREDSAWHYRGSRWDLPQLPAPALVGDTQYANAATAFAALEEIDARLPMPAAAVAQGLEQVRLAARFQVIAPARPRAHLDIGCRAQSRLRRGCWRAICASVRAHGPDWRCAEFWRDKDAAGVAAELRDCIDAWWCVSTEGERGRSGVALGADGRARGRGCRSRRRTASRPAARRPLPHATPA